MLDGRLRRTSFKDKQENIKLKLIIGAGKSKIDGQISTNENELNLIDEETWRNKFQKETITHILAEHVWEHLTYNEGLIAANICFKYLKEGGLLRIAVPDGNYQNEWYQNMIKVGGPGPKDHPAASHRVVYDHNKLKMILENAGFYCEELEYCDEKGNFHYRFWNENDGKIGRSYRFDTRNSENEIRMVSIIIDAKKEKVIKNKII